MTIGEIISRIRTSPKIQNVDARISDRNVYNQMITARDVLIKNADENKELLKMSFLFKPLNYVELIEIDAIEACGIDSDCLIRRTKDPLPKMLKAKFGDIILAVTSIDGYTDLQALVTRRAFTRRIESDDAKYDSSLYYFIEGEYMYFPNLDWEGVRIIAFWQDDELIDQLNGCDEVSLCKPIKDKEFLCPSYLIDAIVGKSIEEIMRAYNAVREDSLMNKNTTS